MSYARLHGRQTASRRPRGAPPGSSPRRPRDRSGVRLAVVLGVVTVLLLVVVKTQTGWPPGWRAPAEPAVKPIDTEALAREVSSVLDAGTGGGTYGVCFKLLDTGQVVGVRSDEAFFAASCYKLPLALMLYEMAAAGEIDMDEQVEYRPEDRELGTGIIVGYRYGSRFSLRDLARLAIVKSDNVAGNMLLRRLGKNRFVEYQERCGARVLPVGSNISSPADLATFAERLWEFGTKGGELGAELLDSFLESEHKDRIAAGLPPGARVANKIGTWPGSVNDVGIVWEGDAAYVLAVMSKDVPSEESGRRTIAAISARVHEFVQRSRGSTTGTPPARSTSLLPGEDRL